MNAYEMNWSWKIEIEVRVETFLIFHVFTDRYLQYVNCVTWNSSTADTLMASSTTTRTNLFREMSDNWLPLRRTPRCQIKAASLNAPALHCTTFAPCLHTMTIFGNFCPKNLASFASMLYLKKIFIHSMITREFV